MPTATPAIPDSRPRSRRRRFFDSLTHGRLKGRHQATTDYRVTSDLRIPMRDGEVLLADHLAPMGKSRGTVLVRGPYGFGPLVASITGGIYASRGYDVVMVRCRGTFGSGGQFDPMVTEIDDAADTVAWLRQQPWFGGRFATVGGSYLGFTQWALLMDPPPELTTAVIQVAPHDFSRVAYLNGGFTLSDFLSWSDSVTHQEAGFLNSLRRRATADRRQASAVAGLPVTNCADELCDGRATWFHDWIGRRDLDDPFWAPMQLAAALDRVQVPILLQTGWQDMFLQQTFEQYEHLHRRGIDVALTVGPWTHLGLAVRGSRTVQPESLDWLAEHLAQDGARHRSQPVHAYLTGAGQWRDLPTWPPPSRDQVLFPQPDRGLSTDAVTEADATASFTYDPADPTPTRGGRGSSPALGGYQDDTELGRRADVLAFTGTEITAPIEVVGTPVVELSHTTDNPHADLFVRLSEVDRKGKSQNVSDGFLRLAPERANGPIRIELDPVAHRFAAGSRIRLLIAGGSFPHWERNLGTDEDPATSTKLALSRRTIHLASSSLILPVTSLGHSGE
ncbi:CocE/NonD family hydrolase [Pseudofrankia saprophytica]|uniref:CocE/NonD family hydrolase n=1 Tax=Pseudofrankia saprophytica TaxID=298655 RepID=UPI00056B2FD4|nr:CocE/NonD family hydrolase [Pseudofrankia saprophytica]